MMKKSKLFIGLSLAVVLSLSLGVSLSMAASKIVIGHPACLSGKYAKAGEQALGGIKASVDWINNVYGGVKLDGKKVHLNTSTMTVSLKRKL